jgi:TetR/AcrR family transcriptional repressor of nem operon
MIVAIIEGGLVLQRAYGEVRMTARQSAQFRNYLTLLFNREKVSAGRGSSRRAAKTRKKELA